MTRFPASGPVRLRTNLADYPVARALRSGEVRSDLVEFDFCGPKTANQGFKPMVREGAYDAGELAIGTFLQAKVYGKPLYGLVRHPTRAGQKRRGAGFAARARRPRGPAGVTASTTYRGTWNLRR